MTQDDALTQGDAMTQDNAQMQGDALTQGEALTGYLVCTARTCLEHNEGQVIDVEGIYAFPRQKAFAVNKLILQDGATVILAPPKGDLPDLFVEENDGATMLIRGRIFCKQIPPRYRIIGRTPDPYLLDLERVIRFGP